MQDLTDANIKVGLLHFDYIQGTFSREYLAPAATVVRAVVLRLLTPQLQSNKQRQPRGLA